MSDSLSWPPDRSGAVAAVVPDAFDTLHRTRPATEGGRVPLLVSVVVKALNEEAKIAVCLASAFQDFAAGEVEVILVDSLSTDHTVQIAAQQPVRIVQFLHRQDTGCGAAVQLGYQYTRAPFIYVLDGDMVLQPGFVRLALQRLLDDPGLAGVGGKVLDKCVRTADDRRRVAAAARQVGDVEVLALGGGGLYRRTAIEQCGYLGHRGLQANEESELGARLTSRGWRLVRLAVPAVLHEGHAETDGQMMLRLWRNGRTAAAGTVLRSAWGKPWFRTLAREQRHVLAIPAMHVVALVAAYMAFVFAGPLPAAAAWLLVWLAMGGLLSLRARALSRGLRLLVEGHLLAAGLLRGLLRRPASPLVPVAGRELTSPPPPADPRPQAVNTAFETVVRG